MAFLTIAVGAAAAPRAALIQRVEHGHTEYEAAERGAFHGPGKTLDCTACAAVFAQGEFWMTSAAVLFADWDVALEEAGGCGAAGEVRRGEGGGVAE